MRVVKYESCNCNTNRCLFGVTRQTEETKSKITCCNYSEKNHCREKNKKKDVIQFLICFFFRLVTWWIRPSTSTRTESLRKSERKLWSTSCWPTPSSGSSASGSTSRSSTRKQNFSGKDSSIQEKERSRPEGQSRQIK